MHRLVLTWLASWSALAGLACAGPALAAANTGPPAGILPTTTTLAQVIASHKRAVGATSASLGTTTETWLYAEGDLSGTQTQVSSGDDYREDTVLGPFHTADGSYHGQQWDRNANGLTVLVSGVHRRDDVSALALRAATTSQNAVTLLGQTAAPPAYVVRIAPPGGRTEYFFYDRESFLIVRVERAVEGLRLVTTFDDFRTTNGRTVAWHIHESDGRPHNDDDWVVQSLQYGTPVDPARFAIPASDRSNFRLDAQTAVLPGKILADRIILTALIGGRKVDLILDSGASQILLNKSVADALKLPVYGRQTETVAGTYTATRSIVPRIELGKASLDHVAVETAPFVQWADESTPVAGLLGFDFIDNCVVHIDYLHDEVDALNAASFQPPPGAIALPIRLDDRVPIIGAKIAAAVSDAFILDTGADRSALFSSFVAAHPADVADQGLGEQFTESYPFFDTMLGVGGEIKVTHTQVPSLTIGSATFPRWLFSVVHDNPAFESEDYDGIIGQDVLRNFDVWLDYQHLRIYMLPNDRYRARWGS
jgi:hypothetical protein